MASNEVNSAFGSRIFQLNQQFRRFLNKQTETKGLNVFFASLCVIDLFGVFPIIALPSAIIKCGFYGIPLLFFVIILQIYTAVVLGRCWLIAEKLDPNIVSKSRYPYAAVAELIYGKRMRIFVMALINVTVFGASVPNILVASQNLQLIGQRISHGNFQLSFCYWLIILGILMCPIMWFGSPKNMKMLASISVIICLSVSTLIWLCILRDDTVQQNESFFGIELGSPDYLILLKVYGMIAFQFDVHPMLMTIEVDMEQKHRIGQAVCFGLLVTCLMSIVTTWLAAYRYGINITPNVLEILPASNFLYFAIMLVTLQLCLSNAVGSSALFQQVEDYFNIPKAFNIRRCIVRSSIIAVAVLIAEIVPRFDLVMGIIGGTLTGALIFILPPLFYRKIIYLEKMSRINRTDTEYGTLMMDNEDDGDNIVLIRKKSYGKLSRKYISFHSIFNYLRNLLKNIIFLHFLYNDSLLSKSVIAFGLIATLTSTYFNLLNVTSFSDFWSPCINNITHAFLVN